MHRLNFGPRRASRALSAMRVSLMLVGMLGLAVFAAQSMPTPTAHAASWLFYQRGYYLDNGWMCYGWSNGAYHCTHHWHRAANGTLVSENTAWVPNYLQGTVVRRAAPVYAPVYHAPAAAPAPVQHTTYTPPVNMSGQSVTGEIAAVFGPYASQALNVARCESGFNPNAFNASSSASGVFQFLPSTWATTAYAGYSPFNASANIHAAYQVFARDGYSWREWTCQP